MNAFAGIRPNFPRKGGVKTRPPPLLFSLAFAVGVICFPVGVQPPQSPANFTLARAHIFSATIDITVVTR